jgi:opacity protein-like surface antigen
MKKIISAVSILIIVLSTNLYSQTPFSVGAKVGADIPLGDFSNLYKGGVGGEVGLYYSTPFPGLALSLTIGYDGFKYKNAYFTTLIENNFGVPVSNFSPSWTATDIPVMVGAKYSLPIGTSDAYVTGEVGLHLMNFSDRLMAGQINVSSSNPLNIVTAKYSESSSETGFGFALGGGVEIPIVPKIALDIAVKYNYSGITYSKSYTVFRNNNEQFTTNELKNISYATAKLGVIIHL